MADGAGDQPLLDTRFPDITTRLKHIKLNEYGSENQFKHLNICLTKSSSKNDSQEALDLKASDSAAEAIQRAESNRTKGKAGVVGAGAYNQIYVILQPPNPDIVTNTREIMFRFGNWCYHGSADLGFSKIGLAQLPIVMPRLHQQQHRLQSTCEYAEMPKESKFRKFLHHFADM